MSKRHVVHLFHGQYMCSYITLGRLYPLFLNKPTYEYRFVDDEGDSLVSDIHDLPLVDIDEVHGSH